MKIFFNVFAFLFFLLLPFSLFAQEAEENTPEVETQEDDGFELVDGLEQWTHEFDVSDLEPGRYNIIIRGRDHTGNLNFSKPINIEVDPESDLPIANIANPAPDMRVGQNLNILGTCVDDDQVMFVEIRVDDGEFIRAEGSGFWSYFLDTSEMEDGYYTITVRGTDINGLVGHEKTVGFNLDRKTPENEVSSHDNGALVNGRVTLEGTVDDKNGIRELRYSLDGERFDPVKLDLDKKTGINSFSLNINTNDFEDGAQILWLKSVDNMGSEGLSAFLYFVDNKAPEVSIIDPPEEDSTLNGTFTITGSIYDEVGVTQMLWEAGDESGEIELLPGNPYWSQHFDFTGQKKAKVTITATDITGNVTVTDIERDLNLEADLPVTTVRYPLTEGITYQSRVEGFAFDDDSIVSISYSLDKGEMVELATTGPFSFELPEELESGEHSISIYATDVNGLQGPVLVQDFTLSKEAPQISLNEITAKDGTTLPYKPGMQINPWEHALLKGTVEFLNPSSTQSYSTPGLEDQPLFKNGKPGLMGVQPFEIDLTQLPPGFANVEIIASDIYENISTLSAYLTVEDLSVVKGEDGIYLPESANNTYVITPDHPLQGRVISLDLASLEVDGAEASAFRIETKDEWFSISPGESGVYENVRLRMQNSAGNSLSSSAITLIVDKREPQIRSLKTERRGGSVEISGNITDDSSLALATLTVGEDSRNISLNDDGSFTLSYPAGNLPAGMPMAIVHVEDQAGNAVLDQVALENLTPFSPSPDGKDPAAMLVINWPAADSLVYNNDSLSLSGELLNSNDLASISCDINGQILEGRLNKNGFTVDLSGLEAGTYKVSLSGTDSLGKSIKAPSLSFKLIEPFSSVSIDSWEIPEEGGESGNYATAMTLLRREETLFRIKTAEASVQSNLRYQINGGEILPLNEKNGSFTLSIDNSLPFMKNEIALFYTDYKGEEKSINSFFYLLDPRAVSPVNNAPGIRFSMGDPSRNLNQIVLAPGETLEGYFFGRPLQSAAIISDSSIPEIKQQGQELVLSSSEEGKAENVQILATTTDGQEFIYGPFTLISDNQPPELTLEIGGSPWWLQNSLPLSGSVSDSLAITSLSYRFDEEENGKDLPFSQNEEGQLVFLEEISLSSLEDGPHLCILEAVDEAGNRSEKAFQIVKDVQVPSVVQLTPAPDALINGKVLFSVKGQDDRGLASIEFAPDGENFSLLDNPVVGGYMVDFTLEETLADLLTFRVTDRSGNQTLFQPVKTLDIEADKPEVMIQLPLEETVVRTDFVVSGMAFDDDGIKNLYWRMDEDEFTELPGSNNFEIPFLLEEMTDNGHVVEVKAVDLWGTESEVAQIEFMVSKAAPVSKMLTPLLEETNRGIIRITGESFDANGIKEVYISVDNGNTFNLAEGTEEWWYDIQSEYLEDGTQALLVRAVDNTDHAGLYSSLINIDNTAPYIELKSFDDGYQDPMELPVIGRAFDGVSLEQLTAEITPIEGDIPASQILIKKDLSTEGLFIDSMSLKDLAPGWYNLKITAVDKAENTTYLSRNFQRIEATADKRVEISFPMEGEDVHHKMTIQGRVVAEEMPDRVTLFLNDRRLDSLEVKPNGFFAYPVPLDALVEGPVAITAQAEFDGGETVISPARNVNYIQYGPWISIENYQAGDFLNGRPWLHGTAGYAIPQEEYDLLEEDKKAIKEMEDFYSISSISISLDNGKSFEEVGSDEEWRYRIETGLLRDGQLSVLLRARFNNGDLAVDKTLLYIDETLPDVKLLIPEEGMRFNDTLTVEGAAWDYYGLSDVSISLRKGDKARYQVPAFIQGLYLDIHVLGASSFEVGAGLTFFDDNVKLQIAYGIAPAGERFDGNVISAKLLANVALLPFGYFFGPDWEFYSMSFAVGANFAYFTMDGSDHGDQGPLVLGAMLLQWEFANITTEWNRFNNFGVYAEGQFWFISSDIEGGIQPKFAIGIRSSIF